ncbi:hypothetical protein OESDEN_10694 [Oesophagostomum dentatum]|uniref:Uncharacterized protein n=1 Tax=Oesophagostomum dentatum TaxID=61180 RepID=A0A0B1SZY3_OESDE|nr:hypothetical protein OESDEN_10694 [Oesophagostomum dentatum]
MSQSTTRSNKKNDTMNDKRELDDNELDFEKLSTKDILDWILARNKDPVITRLIQALSTRLSDQMADGVEAERSVVIYGLEESSEERPSAKQSDDEKRVGDILDTLGVQCRPLDVHRMGKFDNSKKRLMLMGGRKYEISVEDHIFAALQIFLDIVYIWMLLYSDRAIKFRKRMFGSFYPACNMALDDIVEFLVR